MLRCLGVFCSIFCCMRSVYPIFITVLCICIIHGKFFKMQTRDPARPRVPRSPLFRYLSEKRQSYTNKHPGLSITDVAKALSKKYKKLPAEKRVNY